MNTQEFAEWLRRERDRYMRLGDEARENDDTESQIEYWSKSQAHLDVLDHLLTRYA